ncbi:MAG: alpha/beta hydrolase [Hyphomonadaceae bacterium]
MIESDETLAKIHPELREFAAQFIPDLQLNADTLQPFREGFGDIPLPEGQPVRRQMIGGSDGQPDVPVLVINDKPGQSRPGLLHMHGGGFVLGAASTSIARIMPLALELDLTIVSVDYRLAPETIYSGSIADNYAALQWLYSNAQDLGIDTDRIGVIGESAGGGHAAIIAIEARNRGEIDIAFQALIYPMLDDRTGSTVFPQPPIGQVLWGPTANKFGWAAFLGMAPGQDNVPVQAVPARTSDLQGLPPTFVAVGELDLFYPENQDYVERLRAANVEAELLTIPAAFHGFDMVEGTAPALQLKEALLSALRKGLGLG